MKKFVNEFKTFISRGNVLDMSVGIIIGTAFTAIVTAITNHLLKPFINWILALIFGSNSLDGIYTYLKKVIADDGTVDLANSIYLDWGAIINAIVNFLLVALILFLVLKAINKFREKNEQLVGKIKKSVLTKEDRKILKERGVKLTDNKAVAEYLAEKDALIKAEEEKAQQEAEEKAKKERLENPTTEDLLKQIKELLIQLNEKK